ncbi:hypothetical protein GQ43DRAFT_463609 [Delitschia confertaspora ATCC 74209]|uniref:HTH TFE/IIEalpha-type domain-containing protein n=1 Tax=Delitschia confertaspora ATCC 74209 TaxID=1513339 RepID=A0A9P4JKM6_9PLEO|nr:hypothetical protein GQ43DRAFT_463609 [Delitschia confertaspora ATCC 74209]
MDPLNLARVFVKTVVRMFYETEHIAVIDALVFHGALSLADIAVVLEYGKQQKTAQKLCGRLKEGGLISVFARAELRDGAMKAVTREYYYIDYRRAIDATKYRIHILDERIKENSRPSEEKKEYTCNRCKSQWTQMEVLSNVDPMGRASGFLCLKCNNPLDSTLSEGAVEPEHDDTPAMFNRQFGPLLKLMQQIDSVTIPAVEGEDAVNGAIELPRDKDINPAAKHEPVPTQIVRPTAVKGIVTAPEKIDVQIASAQEYSEAQRAEEEKRKAKIAAQNQLPAWHTKSTITDGPTNGVPSPSATNQTARGAAGTFQAANLAEEVKTTDPNMEAYFRAMEEEKRREAAEQEEEEEEEDEDDEDEFEDVVTTAVTVEAPEAKRLKLDSPAASTPATGATPAEGATPASAAAPTPAGDQDESDEDDEEFESVL